MSNSTITGTKFINALSLFGLKQFAQNKDAVTLSDAPGWTNPRPENELDKRTVRAIAQTGVYDNDVLVYKDGDKLIPLDGRTRLTGVGLFLRDNSEQWNKWKIPVRFFEGTKEEAQLEMIRRNLAPYRGQALSKAATARAFRRLEVQGITQEQMLTTLGLKNNKSGITELNRYKAISDAVPEVVQAFEAGKISFTSASDIGKRAAREQKGLVEKLIKENAKARQELGVGEDDLLDENQLSKMEIEPRKRAGIREERRGLVSYAEAMQFIVGIVYPSVDAILVANKVDKDWRAHTDDSERLTKLKNDEARVMGMWETGMALVRPSLADLTLEKQIEAVVAEMTPEAVEAHKAAMRELRTEVQLCKKATVEAGKTGSAGASVL